MQTSEVLQTHAPILKQESQNKNETEIIAAVQTRSQAAKENNKTLKPLRVPIAIDFDIDAGEFKTIQKEDRELSVFWKKSAGEQQYGLKKIAQNLL